MASLRCEPASNIDQNWCTPVYKRQPVRFRQSLPHCRKIHRRHRRSATPDPPVAGRKSSFSLAMSSAETLPNGAGDRGAFLLVSGHLKIQVPTNVTRNRVGISVGRESSSVAMLLYISKSCAAYYPNRRNAPLIVFSDIGRWAPCKLGKRYLPVFVCGCSS